MRDGWRDGLEWTVGVAVEIELRFQISPALCGTLAVIDTSLH